MKISDVAINISNNYNLSISRSLEIEAKALKNIELIESGFKFGEEDVYDPGCYFEFKLLELDKSKLKMVLNLLNIWQKSNIILWSIFNNKKFKQFYSFLLIGMNSRAAYNKCKKL